MLIAAWSGLRNLSTAMMYAYAGRDDCATRDEPFYAAYLHRTGLGHPMRDEILASQPVDPAQVVESCAGYPGKHLYLKLMAQHMIEGVPLGWAETAQHSTSSDTPPASSPASAPATSCRASTTSALCGDTGFIKGLAAVLDSADIRRAPPECSAVSAPRSAFPSATRC